MVEYFTFQFSSETTNYCAPLKLCQKVITQPSESSAYVIVVFFSSSLAVFFFFLQFRINFAKFYTYSSLYLLAWLYLLAFLCSTSKFWVTLFLFFYFILTAGIIDKGLSVLLLKSVRIIKHLGHMFDVEYKVHKCFTREMKKDQSFSVWKRHWAMVLWFRSLLNHNGHDSLYRIRILKICVKIY